MCDRHGLPFADAQRLTPLVGRALASKPDVRDRILTLVERNLSRRADGDRRSTPERVFLDLDEEVLLSVSRVLHRWSPKGKLLDLSDALPGLFPPGMNFDD